MTEFKWTEEVEMSVQLEWRMGELRVFRPTTYRCLRHERNIPESFPVPLAKKCREIIQANRELEDGETRLNRTGEIVKMRVEGNRLRLEHSRLRSCDLDIFTERELRENHGHAPERLAYLLKHRELQPNQVRFDDGEVVGMRMGGRGLCIGGFYAPLGLSSDSLDSWRWIVCDKSITDPIQRQRVRDFYERERRIESKEMRFDAYCETVCAVPKEFNNRRVKVTFEDLGPIESK